ncbi:serine/threonine-protein kinase [Duganella callida]|uniref:non-specific serine/threonine protein kinase n=1 Tax=Duganella callida TaxID=2561932 RepID=A0A4Y9SCH6_9BURK|nr:serine/threonine-protein kinase [Duganella callida]TFW20084.1 serine/threonine protein kinase [Duganella callida]
MSEVNDAPRQIGKYRLDGMLGQGAMGVVYRATDPLIGRTVALKTVRRDLGDDAPAREIVERFRKEAQAAGRLMHPNIVTVYEYGEEEHLAYIAMEYIDGTPLSALLREQPASLAQVLEWYGDLLTALAYSHAHGVVHRDIKPANLLVTREGRIKISDFGIARIESSTLTQTGAMLGTPSYMSPEQFRGEAVDGRSDLFSAGVVLYQLLTGQRPFTGSAATVMQQVLNHTPPAPTQLNPTLPAGLDTVLRHALAKDREARYAGAREFLQALTAALRSDDGDQDATILLAPSGPAASLHGTAADTLAPPDWLAASMPALELILARQIGPMAKLLLRKIVPAAPDFDSLGRQLLAHIPSPQAQALFQQQLAEIRAGHLLAERSTPMLTVPPPTQGSQTMPAPLSQELTGAAVPLLAQAIGPIAAIVVKRVARQATGRKDFVALLASHIEAPAARARFLEQAAWIGGA